MKLPEIALNATKIVDKSKGMSERRLKQLDIDASSIGNQLKVISRNRKQSVPFLDKLEFENDYTDANALTSRRGRGKRNEKYKEILNEIASTRSLMLANTPHR